MVALDYASSQHKYPERNSRYVIEELASQKPKLYKLFKNLDYFLTAIIF